MKKIIALALVFLALFPCAFAESIDYSSMTAAQLREVIVQARAALAEKEEPFSDKCVVFDDHDIKVTVTGIRLKEYFDDYYEIDVTVVNKSDKTISVRFDDCYINGWQIKTGTFILSKIGPKKNSKNPISLLKLKEQADVNALEEIEDFSFKVVITDSETYETLYKTEENILTFAW